MCGLLRGVLFRRLGRCERTHASARYHGRVKQHLLACAQAAAHRDLVQRAQAHVSVSPLDERVTPALPPQAGTVRWSDTQARAQRLQTITNWQAIAA